MKKLLFFVSLGFLLFFGVVNSVQYVHAYIDGEYNVNITTVINGAEDSTTTLENQKYGSLITPFTSTDAPEGHEFSFWIVNGVVRKDLTSEHKFAVTANLEIAGIFEPLDGSAHAVIFIDSNGKLIQTSFVLNDQTVTPLPSIEGFSKPQYVVSTTPWKEANGNAAVFTNITESKVFVLQYELAGNVEPVTITVNGTPKEYAYNEVVTVTTDLEGFTHWEENGVVVSYDESYTFTVLTNRELLAKNDGSSPQPLVTLINVSGIRAGYDSLLGQIHIPTGYEIIELGFLVSDKEKELVLDDIDAVAVRSNSIQPTTKEFLRSFNQNSYKSFRAYAILKNDSTISVIYSANSVKKIEVSYFNLNKASHDNQTVVINGYELLPAERNGFEFLGWYDNPQLNGEPVEQATKSGNLYAKWGKHIQLESVVYETGFESPDFGKGTVYDNVEEVQWGPDGYKWNISMGSPTDTSSAIITDGQSIQLRYYSNIGALGYLSTDFSILNPTKIQFKAKGLDGVKFTIWYSSNGVDYIPIKEFAAKTSAQEYDVVIPATGNIYIKLGLTTVSGRADTSFDDIKIYSRDIPDTTSPIITGLTPTYNLDLSDAEFDLLDNITAEDDTSGDITSKIIVLGDVNWGVAGSYPVTYTVIDDVGNKKEETIIIYISDLKQPRIIGADVDLYYTIGDTIPSLTTGITAINGYGTDLTSLINVSGTVNWETEGVYGVTYTVESNGKTAEVVRTIYVETEPSDITPPVITTSTNELSYVIGESIPSTDAEWISAFGVIAEDGTDGSVDVTVLSNNVNINIAGEYTIEFKAVDLSGNISIKEVSVIIDEPLPSLFTVTARYSGSTTQNMTDENNAEIIGLNKEIFDVVSTKRTVNPLHVGLNKSGQIRLYGSTDGNGNILAISIADGYKITSIQFKFGSTVNPALIKAGETEKHNGSLTSNGTLTFDGLDVSEFSIKNITESTGQIYIISIEITYIPG